MAYKNFMQESTEAIRDKILDAALPAVAFDGWTLPMLRAAAQQGGYAEDMANAVFPDGVTTALEHFAGMMDRAMLTRLGDLPTDDLRIRDRIRAGVLARLAALEPHREAERLAVAYWMRPNRVRRGGKVVWQTADAVWTWAGDIATDYNRITKRGLLSGVLVSTTLVWLRNDDPSVVAGFLDRRLENVLRLGKFGNGLMGGFQGRFKRRDVVTGAK